MSVSVGDFAENLLAQGTIEAPKEGAPSLEANPSIYSADVTAQAPDISDVEVPANFVQSIVEEKTPEMPIREEKSSPPSPPQEISEVAELKTLIQEIKDLLLEVKGTLTEVTAAGSLGVNLAGPDATKTKEQENAEKMDVFLNKIRKKKKKAITR
jgi:hypothetical protein